MNKLLCLVVLIMIMLVGDKSYACDWIRLRYPPTVVMEPVVQPVPVVWQYATVPTVVYQPVVVHQPVLVLMVPVVEQRVVWGWPNYYVAPVIRPTYIRY